MILCEMTMFPTDKGESVSEYVARVIAVIDASGLSYQLTPMGTIIEGDWNDITRVAGECFAVLQSDCRRINISMKMDYRAGDQIRMRSKTEKIESILGKKLST